MYIPRKLDVAAILEKKSCFLFGPRQCGKSSLIRETLPDAYVLDLLSGDTFRRLARNPGYIDEICREPRPVVIDEIQKMPSLLDEVHRLIETKGINFLLTGSSARKLRKGGVNLLGGRARVRNIHPFSASELGDAFDLDRASMGLSPAFGIPTRPTKTSPAMSRFTLNRKSYRKARHAIFRHSAAFSRLPRFRAASRSTTSPSLPMRRFREAPYRNTSESSKTHSLPKKSQSGGKAARARRSRRLSSIFSTQA